MTSFRLDGKTALITGASRGIGEAIALKLSENGAHCILCSRKEEGLKNVLDKIEKNGGSAEFISCHMGKMDEIDSMVKAIDEKHGKLDILVCNAATNPHFGEMVTADEMIWDKIMEVNVKGPFFLIKKSVPLMEKSGKGSIINVSSVNGISPAFFQGVYSISKAALISMTKAYAKELAPKKIRVNGLLPGLTDTKFASALIKNDDIREMVLQTIPMGRYADPSEMSGTVLYLASEESSFTTGALIVCDGGMIA